MEAALTNPERTCLQIRTTAEGEAQLKAQGIVPLSLSIRIVSRTDLDALLPGAVHQGVAVQVRPLAEKFLDTQIAGSAFLALDHITDPQNFGALLRSAAAFDLDGVLYTPRHSPPFEGTLAKAASGALDRVPLIQIPNLAQGLKFLQDRGFWCVGLSEHGDQSIQQYNFSGPHVLVMGAEGKGMRRLTTDLCDTCVRLPTNPAFPTLNVSTAAAVALYALTLSQRLAGASGKGAP